jgi:alpha-N-acetylglucosamine transferase
MVFGIIVGMMIAVLSVVIVGLLLKIQSIKEYISTQEQLNKEIYKFLEGLQKQQIKNTSDIKLLLSATTATLKEFDAFKLQIANTFTELNKYFNGEVNEFDVKQDTEKDKDKLN